MTTVLPPAEEQKRPEKRPRRRRVVALVATAALGGGVWAAVDRASSETAVNATAAGESVIQQFPVGERFLARPFTAKLLDGSTFDSAAGAGKVSVYNVWGSWCAPCRVETPDLRRVALETAGRVVFTGINVRDGRDAALAFERTNQVPYPSISADDSGDALLSFGTSLGVTAVPTTIILDREGRIAARVVGRGTYTTLSNLIDDVLAEEPTGAASTDTTP